ncbi:MAG: hypothetical protein FWF92_04290 [Oscillospiraceae bacterium]|nr:hypothetical protein [Oscillospiraceae bacterium]
MDKREEDILDDILDGEETEEYEEVVIPESLRGEQDNETEEKNEVNEKSEEKEPESPDLSAFLDENTEVEDIDAVDPELDGDLSKFVDDDDSNKKDKQKKNERDEIEKEIREKIAREKTKNKKLIKNVIIISVLAVVIIAGGLFAFFQIEKLSNNYIMTIENQKVTLEELKLTILLNELFNQGNYNPNPKQTAIDDLAFYMIVEKEAKDRNISLSEEEKNELKLYIEDLNNYLESQNIELPKVSNERYELILSYMILNSIYTQLIDIIVVEQNYMLNETVYTEEFENYKANYKSDYIDMVFKYVLTDKKEIAEEAREALISGLLSTDEVIKKYFIDYPEEDENAEIPIIELYQIDFITPEETEYLLSLKISEISEILYILEQYYIIFIPESINIPTNEELSGWFKDYYEQQEKNQLFFDEYDLWYNETVIKFNDKVIENFDENAYLEKLYDY